MKNEETGGYGGILIRSIFDIDNKEIYKGPVVCAMKLFSGTSAFSESIKTKIIEYNKFTVAKILKGPRVGLGKNAIKSGTDKLNYRYFIDPNDNR